MGSDRSWNVSMRDETRLHVKHCTDDKIWPSKTSDTMLRHLFDVCSAAAAASGDVERGDGDLSTIERNFGKLSY